MCGHFGHETHHHSHQRSVAPVVAAKRQLSAEQRATVITNIKESLARVSTNLTEASANVGTVIDADDLEMFQAAAKEFEAITGHMLQGIAESTARHPVLNKDEATQSPQNS